MPVEGTEIHAQGCSPLKMRNLDTPSKPIFSVGELFMSKIKSSSVFFVLSVAMGFFPYRHSPCGASSMQFSVCGLRAEDGAM